MRKFIFVLFAVLLAVLPHAYSLGEPLENAQQETNVITDDTHFPAEGFIAGIRRKAEQVGEELKKRVNEFLRKIDEQVNKSVQKINDRIKEIIGDDSNLPECQKLAEKVRNTALETVANRTKCIREILETGKGYIANLREINNEVKSQLKELREEARQCKNTEDVKNIKTTIKTIICLNKVGLKAFWVTVQRVPEVTANAAKLRFLIKNLPKNLSQCVSKNGSDTLGQKVDALLAGVKQCVKEHGIGNKQQPQVTEVPEVTLPTTTEVTKAPSEVEQPATPEIL